MPPTSNRTCGFCTGSPDDHRRALRAAPAGIRANAALRSWSPTGRGRRSRSVCFSAASRPSAVNGSRRPSRSTRRYGRSRGTSSAQPIPRHPVGTTTSRGTASARPIPRHLLSTAHPAAPRQHDPSRDTPSARPIPRHPVSTAHPPAPPQHDPSHGTPSARPIPRRAVGAVRQVLGCVDVAGRPANPVSLASMPRCAPVRPGKEATTMTAAPRTAPAGRPSPG